MNTRAVCLLAAAFTLLATSAPAAAYRNPYGKVPTNATPGDRMFAEYFRAETRTLGERGWTGCLTHARKHVTVAKLVVFLRGTGE